MLAEKVCVCRKILTSRMRKETTREKRQSIEFPLRVACRFHEPEILSPCILCEMSLGICSIYVLCLDMWLRSKKEPSSHSPSHHVFIGFLVLLLFFGSLWLSLSFSCSSNRGEKKWDRYWYPMWASIFLCSFVFDGHASTCKTFSLPPHEILSDQVICPEWWLSGSSLTESLLSELLFFDCLRRPFALYATLTSRKCQMNWIEKRENGIPLLSR